MKPITCLIVFVLLSCAGGSSEGPAPAPAEPACTSEILAFDSVDADEINNALTADFGEARGIDAWAGEHGKKPAVRFHSYKNGTLERIELRAIAADLQKTMVGSGRVELLADLDVHDEKAAPADLLGSMSILSRDEATATELIRVYVVEVTLSTRESGAMVWVATHQIKKMCELPARPTE